MVGAFARVEFVETFADGPPEAVDGSLGGFSQGFELGEQLLDRIEVRAVWRKVEEARACGFDQCSHLPPLVAGEVVYDDDVAGLEFRQSLIAACSMRCRSHNLVNRSSETSLRKVRS